MRVLFLIDGLGPGGKERQTAALVKGLAEQPGIAPMLLCLNKSGHFEAEIRQQGVSVICLQRKIRWDPLIFGRLLRLALRFRPSIIHTTCTMTSFYALPVARLLGAVLVNGSIRNAFQPPFRRWRLERWLLKRSDVRIANSEAGLASRGLQRDGERNWVIYNGFDFQRLQRSGDAASAPFLDRGKKVVGMVANFSDYKDHTTFFQAACRILERRQDVVFLAVGGGKTLPRFHRWASSKGLGDILLPGRCGAVEKLVGALDVGVLSTYTEGISNSVMEYMAWGKPVVVTEGGGSRELVLDGENGFLVPPSDPAAMARRIELLLDDSELRRKMGLSGKSRIEQEFSIRGLVEKTVEVYRHAMRPSAIPARRKGLKTKAYTP
ncbi:MAG: glycosyltransferase [Acidobacteriota bacterium]